jgi:hypothetical protein
LPSEDGSLQPKHVEAHIYIQIHFKVTLDGVITICSLLLSGSKKNCNDLINLYISPLPNVTKIVAPIVELIRRHHHHHHHHLLQGGLLLAGSFSQTVLASTYQFSIISSSLWLVIRKFWGQSLRLHS